LSDNQCFALLEKLSKSDNPIIDVLRLDIALTREQLSSHIKFHRNTIHRWEVKFMSVPMFYKEYWNGHPRSPLLDSFQIVVLALIASLKEENKRLNIPSMLRRSVKMLNRNNVKEWLECIR